MSTTLLPPTSGLIGIALVVRSKEGPRFVFHYPAHIRDPLLPPPRWGTELAPSTPDESEDEDDDDDLEDEEYRGLRTALERTHASEKSKRHVNPWDGDDHFDSDGIQVAPWDHMDAFSTSDLASILTPHKAYHKKCFELSLDPVVYITYPIHAFEDGTWKKPKKSKKKKRNRSRAGGTESGSIADIASLGKGDSTAKENKDEEQTKTSPTPEGSFASDNGNDSSGITMFNLVFIMHPHPQEAALRTKDMFEHVAKDMNKALKYAQHYNNYVWKESEKILSMKDKAKDDWLPMSTLWKNIIERSTLALAMKDVFDAIANNELATVRFASNPAVRLSVQIPRPYFLSQPPNNHQPAIPGLRITTANSLNESYGDDDEILNEHFALLLMDDETKIIAEIESDGGQLARPLLEYIRLSSPTLSFQQIATEHSIKINEIRVLAQHLIYYRRAIAVPPLHGRDTYIINPNSDNSKLPEASVQWSKTFPLSPPLATFLADLSRNPKPYRQFAPSKNHRPLYLNMLAWLMRGGWVTQLRTYAWIIVWPEIRYEVQYGLDKISLKKAYDDSSQDSVDEARAAASGDQSVIPTTTEQTAEKARVQRAREKAKQDWLDFGKRPQPVRTEDPSIVDENSPHHIKRIHTITIVDPAKPSHIDSLYLEAISKRFNDEDTRKAWMKLAKYFNGEEALEMIALREAFKKRKELHNLLSHFDEFLLLTRHW